jgi:metal-responsive CopG/Arc/MetJ family transcriptional regulator
MNPQSPSQLFTVNSRSKGQSTSRLISVRLPETLLAKLAEVGNEQGLAMSDTIRLVLERGIRASQSTKE